MSNEKNDNLDVLDLIQTLKTGDTHAQISACDELQAGKDPRALPALAAVFRGNVHKYVLPIAASAIASFGELAIPTLLEIIQYDDLDKRGLEHLEEAFKAIGPPATPKLLELLERDNLNWWVSETVVSSLGAIQDPIAIPALQRALYNDTGRRADVNLIETAGGALAHIGTPTARVILLEALEAESVNIRASAISALKWLKEKRATKKLIDLLSDNSGIGDFTRICDEAAKALEEFQTTEAFEAVRAWRNRVGDEKNQGSDKRLSRDNPYTSSRIFKEAELKGVDFELADLRGTIFQGANLEEANLNSVQFEGADLSDARLAGAKLRGATLIGANLRQANFERADLRNASLAGTGFWGATFREADLSDADFRGSDLRRVDFGNANLLRANFGGALLRQINFEGTNLFGVDFGGARLWNITYDKETIWPENFDPKSRF